jgi:hypothetical protein
LGFPHWTSRNGEGSRRRDELALVGLVFHDRSVIDHRIAQSAGSNVSSADGTKCAKRFGDFVAHLENNKEFNARIDGTRPAKGVNCAVAEPCVPVSRVGARN